MNVSDYPRLQFAFALLVVTALLGWLVRRVFRHHARHPAPAAAPEQRRLIRELLHAAIGPATLLFWFYGLYAIARVTLIDSDAVQRWPWLMPTLRHAASLGVFVSFLWFFHRFTRVIDARLKRFAARTPGRIDDVLLPLFGTALRVTVPILAIFLLLRLWPLPPATLAVLHKLLGVALVGAIAWTVRRAIMLIDAALLGQDGAAPASIAERALYTRVRLLRRLALVLLTLFAAAAVLMMFDEVRDVGRSLLASAGLAGIVIGFAAQRSLGTLFAGIQIALTQPIRIGDQVLVEGDVGNVEEITLTYVVVRVWDARRIVLPISYFIEKPFQNWTRVQTNMLSPLVMRFDFSLPLGELRAFLRQEIARSPHWDKNVFNVQVTNADDRTMEVRVLASAPDSGASFNLQCELREKAIGFVRRHYPDALPKQRQEQRRVAEWTRWTDGDAPLAKPAPRAEAEKAATTAAEPRR